MAGHNVINPRCTLTSIMHFYTFIKKGLRVQNIETIWLLSLRVIGEVDILLLQSNYDGFLIHYNKLGELYTIK